MRLRSRVLDGMTAQLIRQGRAISVHHLRPGSHEVPLRTSPLSPRRHRPPRSAELRVRTEDEVDPGAGPLDRIRLAVAPLVHAFRGGHRLPVRAHVEQKSQASW